MFLRFLILDTSLLLQKSISNLWIKKLTHVAYTQGPLVGEKVSSEAITTEYARADPTYVAKTMVSSKSSK
jgi:hypothetical protein